jgi:hypothetical protein
MNALALGTAPSPGRGYLRRLRSLVADRMPDVVVFAGVLTASGVLQVFHLAASSANVSYVAVAREQFGHSLVRILLIVTLISACEATLWTGLRRLVLQAGVLAAGIGFGAVTLTTMIIGNAVLERLGLLGEGFSFYIVWISGAAAAFMSWYYHARGRSHRSLEALRTAQLESEAAKKRLLESRLQVLEAQVEPRFLLDTLARVQGLYTVDHDRAERTLEDLIDYLRAALPQLRERASTVGRELDLVIAYLRIVGRAAAHCVIRSDLAPEFARALYAPPMVMLPLAQCVVASCAAGEDAAPVSITLDISEECATLRIEFDASPEWDAARAFDSVGLTMQMLFGSNGRVEGARNATGRASAAVTWPVFRR